MDGTLLNWLKDVGTAVNAGDVIAEVEADKATVEIEAPEAGVLLEQRASVGDELKEGTVIGVIGAAGEVSQTTQEMARPAQNGGKAPAPQAAAQPAQAEAQAEPHDYAKPADGGEASTAETPAEPADGNLPDGIKASPLARNIAEERHIDLRQVRGSGPGGRITRTDVENFTPAPAAAPSAPAAAPAAAVAPAGQLAAPTRKMPEGADIEIIDLSTMRKRIATVTVESKQWTPHFYVTTEIDTDPLINLRKQLNDTLPEGATKISVNDLIVKAAALTVRQFPNLNSHYYGDKIARHKRINVGIAVALPNGGLLNVVAQDADKVALGTLAQTNKEMIARAREGKVKPADITGATFTVSNLGPYNVEHFSAIINPPESMILAVGTAARVPVVQEDGSVGVGNRMKITVSVDHRVSDGAEAALYLQALKDMIEHPMRIVV
jgi:pyruvate dehydrogenase E2 component (dihydrolipoamide acetyltransferase)